MAWGQRPAMIRDSRMKNTLILLAAGALMLGAGYAAASGGRDAILAGFATEAKQADPAFKGFSVAAGKAFWTTPHTGGNPETPSCTTCHTKDAHNQGQTRAGKLIKPMAVSVTPARFTDPAKVAKWFDRNCKTVLGRDCTAEEKGNVISYLSSL
jgi:hypothetical protein